jgi:hypothetical protein
MRKRLVIFITSAGLLLSAAGVVLLAPQIAGGTETPVGVIPTVIGSTGSTGTSTTTGTSGTTGTTGTTGVTGATSTTTPIDQSGLAVSETTGYQVKVGTARSIESIPRSGTIVAWTISLGDPTASQTTYFDTNEGGPASAGIAILKASPHLEYTLVAQSPIVQLQPYFGKSAEFALATTIPVKKGEIVALTVPTWAPALALSYGSGTRYGQDTSWRASRPKTGCKTDTSTQTAQQSVRSTVEYYCLYQTARLTYTALLISTP